MAHHFFLPQLTDENISVPKEFGHWNDNEKKIFLGISDAILIDEQALTRGVSSIPDIWARPLLFQSAVKPTTKHPLKKRCIQEWRGLLSLLALHKVLPNLKNLEIIPISLDNETFSTALRNLVPNPVQLEKNKKYSWTDVLMIRFDGLPLGAFSPTTLVYSAADYQNKLKDKPFPFKDKDGYLSPPKTKDDGLEYVGEWLYSLQANLNVFFDTDQANPDHQIVGNINDLIAEWLKEIRLELGLKENEPINAKKYKVDEDIVDIKAPAPYLNEYNVYEKLLHPLKQDGALEAEAISDILLNTIRNKSKYQNIIVITEKLLSENVNIWGEIRPKALGESPKAIIEKFFNAPSGTKINNVDIGEKGAMWIRPELYFLSDSLLKAKSGNILSERENEMNTGTKYILPFKKEMLDFFSPEDINQTLHPIYKDDSGIVKFSFILPMSENEVKVEKTYKAKTTIAGEGEIVETDIPTLDIFPDYLGDNWRRYYLFQGKAENFKINPLFVSNSIVLTQREREVKNSEFQQRVRITEINGHNSFPEALEVTNENGSPQGLVFINRTEKIPGLRHNWTIGIDFGTSNTNVYKNRGTADSAERWIYNFPEYYRTITQSESNTRSRILEEYFFPTRKINLPIPTTLKMYNLAKKENMVLDYFIYYPVEYKFPENVLSDIKWDGEGERKTEYFLESLLFLLLIEVVKDGVANVQLACSYPKAFSETNISVFKREWEAVFDRLLKTDDDHPHRVLNIHSGNAADNEVRIIINKPVFKTEGIAAGEYFASELTISKIEERANKEIAAICLDVGGGTTDISIWYLNNIEFDASVLLAGRQIANLLQKNNRVRELLFTKDAAIALEEKKNEPGYFSARLNLILKNEEQSIQEMLVKHANNKDIQWLRQIIALEFGALAFYAAEVCVSTNEKVGGILERIADAGINLHWGGNAAKLINWIDFGKYSRDGIASKILNSLFFNCLNDKALSEKSIKPKEVSQLQSPGHKSEASGGLVVMDLTRNNGNGQSFSAVSEDEYAMPGEGGEPQHFYTGTICGENIELTDKKISFFSPVSNKDLYDENKIKFKTTTLERLIRFVEVLNFFGIKNGLFTEDTKIVLGDSEKRIVKDGVQKEFIRMQSLKESQRLIEPVFIMEVKLLLEIIKSKMS